MDFEDIWKWFCRLSLIIFIIIVINNFILILVIAILNYINI